MDIADKAAEIEEMNRAQALAARRRIPAAPGCAECEDCGDPIPEARRRAYPSATRCTECQARHERHAKNR
ncbi:conjugal transfer protein TraR [Cardiobacterium hominis]|uniref:Phage/conjugal plasmid C-4 type zinc finger protein, TraR family n=1 Tax=Cardiobacterium hominis (strain ATCC 15826 / DSM 8339 / NCTC 10426 / 6573) TaxID=638300 RepID=C8N773_CARH6|nr:TraR/DksA C4-type zinc finger protein [Cardiobacterium hominis]EEV89569.1 phage/conjugal plasmid C-4 type zinc finger protein, TraR family [Cardiobacterium hominis ATCC 15826]VEG76972.1 conjugal transfer protein TraR [Cardiobacterium hominis]